MSFKKITFSEPVESLSGKKNKNDEVCFFQGHRYGQRAWGVGARDLVTHPLSQGEMDAREKFSVCSKNVAVRRKQSSPTYENDLAAFLNQKRQPGGIQDFVKFLWADEKQKYQA